MNDDLEIKEDKNSSIIGTILDKYTFILDSFECDFAMVGFDYIKRQNITCIWGTG